MEKTRDRTLDRKIAELTQKLNLFDLEEILDAAIEQIPRIVQAERVSIYLIDEEEKQFVARRRTSHKLQEHFVEKIPLDSQHSILPHVLEMNEPILIRDVQEYIEKHDLSITISRRQRYTSGSCMLVPLKVRLPNGHEKVLGIVNFAEKTDFTPFTKYDLDLASHLVELLGTSVHNCLVVEKKLGGRHKELLTELHNVKEAFAQKEIDLDEAKKKQTQMLPEIPQILGYDIHVCYSPMETIGGDFYDFVHISDHEIGIVLGDVSGHGIEAALVMSMAKQVLSIYSKLHQSLTETVAYANEEIFSNLKGESFIAVFIGILNTATHIMRYVRAGQTYPILYNPTREPKMSELKSAGVVLGTISGRGERFRSMVEEKHIQFKPGDVLLLYTDGAVEATAPEGEDYGVERLMEMLNKVAVEKANDLVRSLHSDIQNFTKAPQDDDITFLCLKANDICPPSFNTQKLEKSLLQEAESFIIAPDLSYDENVQYQMLKLEEKISELEMQLELVDEEKRKAEDKCEEISTSLEMLAKDPDSYTASLKNQLQVALELPKELIAENARLHKEVEQQKRELRSQESEINQLISQLDMLKDEKEALRLRIEAMGNRRRLLTIDRMQKDLLNSSIQFDKKMLECLTQKDYENALKLLVKYFTIAMEHLDRPSLSNFLRQHFYLTSLFLRYLREFLSDDVEERDRK